MEGGAGPSGPESPCHGAACSLTEPIEAGLACMGPAVMLTEWQQEQLPAAGTGGRDSVGLWHAVVGDPCPSTVSWKEAWLLLDLSGVIQGDEPWVNCIIFPNHKHFTRFYYFTFCTISPLDSLVAVCTQLWALTWNPGMCASLLVWCCVGAHVQGSVFCFVSCQLLEAPD